MRCGSSSGSYACRKPWSRTGDAALAGHRIGIRGRRHLGRARAVAQFAVAGAVMRRRPFSFVKTELERAAHKFGAELEVRAPVWWGLNMRTSLQSVSRRRRQGVRSFSNFQNAPIVEIRSV
jgi:hypothetical protein